MSIDLPFWYNVNDQEDTPERSQCSWTLYFIYFNSFNNSINRIAGLLTSSADIYRSNSGLSMTHILPNIRNSKWMNFQRLSIIIRTGTGKISTTTTPSATENRLSLSRDVLSVTFRRIAHALHVMHLSLISTKTMARQARYCVRSARLHSLPVITDLITSCPSSVRIASIPLFARKTGNTSSSINA